MFSSHRQLQCWCMKNDSHFRIEFEMTTSILSCIKECSNGVLDTPLRRLSQRVNLSKKMWFWKDSDILVRI